MKYSLAEAKSLYWDICDKESDLRYPYYYDEPCVIDVVQFENLKRVQNLLFKSFKYFLPRYEQYDSIIEYHQKFKEIVANFNLEETRIGFYRPDFVIPEKGKIKICELGCRYYEAYWGHGISEFIMEKRNKCSNQGPQSSRIIDKVIDHAFEWWSGLEDSLVVLKGRDREGDIRFYRPFFEEIGVTLHYVYPDTLMENLDLLKGRPVLNAFSQMEIESLTQKEVLAISKSDCLNPLPTVLLLHDKRFLAVLWDDTFRESALGKEDSAFLKDCLIPTYTRKQSKDIWLYAQHHKDEFILKPQLLGKSEGIIPGPLVSDLEWQEAFNEESIETMILQRWINQREFNASIDGKSFKDYGTGMLLCMEDEFYGPGQFRMSSCEVINYIKDDRKMAPWITDDANNYPRPYFTLD